MRNQSKKILVDAVFFQYNRSGIARVWISIFNEWVRSGFAANVLVLDRNKTAPRIDGLAYRVVPTHNYAASQDDRAMLQAVCDEEAADVFVSSYYTIPVTTPSIFMAYDMIPEVLNWDVSSQTIWYQKHEAIRHAASFIAISQNTADDLCRLFPSIRPQQVTIAHCGVDFSEPPPHLVVAFRARHGIDRPYFLLVGSRGTYKNADLFFRAFAELGQQRSNYAIVCTGPWSTLEPEFAVHVGEGAVHMLEVGDEELQCAYAGAIALAYPSIYEGFGMPITEAMACGCPVITCPAGSIPEVADDAVIYVGPSDVPAMIQALHQVQGPMMRALLISKGLQRAAQFSWKKMAAEVAAASLATTQKTASHIDAEHLNISGPNMLSNIIPGEIVNDAFYTILQTLAGRNDLKTFLEIGSSSGAGSTQAFVSALKSRSDAHTTQLFCMELSTERFIALRAAYADCEFVKVYNQSSVSLSEFPSEEEVSFFYAHTRTTLNAYPLTQVLSWLRQDMSYMNQSGLTANGIHVIKTENQIRHFDMVLIDGSEFTGEPELYHTIGARVIALDDVNSHKCFNAFRMLSNHVSYALTHQNLELRNGFAVFERRF